MENKTTAIAFTVYCTYMYIAMRP